MRAALALAALLAVAALWLLRPVGEPERRDAGTPQAKTARSPQPESAPGPDTAGGRERRGGSRGRPAAEVPGAEAAPLAKVPVAPPDPAEGARLRAEADRLLSEGRAMEGIETFRRAVEADPSATNHGDFGALLVRLTALSEGLVHLRRAADLDPGNADRWVALANAYYLKPDPGAAWKAERRAREAEPGLRLEWDHGVRVRVGGAVRSDGAGDSGAGAR